jgi:hypothetical protein
MDCRALAKYSFVLLCAFVHAYAQQDASGQLRLGTGNYWVYTGTVLWADPGEPVRTHTQQITWKIEVLEQKQHGELQAYLVNGSFDDLPGYQPGKEPARYLWIVYRNRFFTLKLDPRLLQRFHDASDPLVDVVQQEQPVLQFPLKLSTCTEPLQPDSAPARDDLFYCWHLEEHSSSVLAISGVPHRSAIVWAAWYRSMPDHQILAFAPGVGFVAYDFSHHGTPSEAHVKLSEAHLK